MRPRVVRGILVGLALVGLGGCAIDVDLSSSPSAANIGDPVTFGISVRNRTTCPVGGVVALLVPFVPRDLFIDRIQDPELRAELSAFVDAFCSGSDVQPPDGAGGCRLEGGDLICDIIPDVSLAGPLPQAAVATTEGGDQVTCGSDGAKITCRFPRAVVEQAQQAGSEASLGALQCAAGDDLALCGALLLDPNETKSAQVQIDVTRGGSLRNWIVSFATVRGGVCTGGVLPRRPCDEDSDCAGVTNTCGTGICVGGDRAGFGCDADGECTNGGACMTCAVQEDGQLLSGVACSTTASAITGAPAASNRGLFAIAAALCLVGAVMLRRSRRLG